MRSLDEAHRYGSCSLGVVLQCVFGFIQQCAHVVEQCLSGVKLLANRGETGVFGLMTQGMSPATLQFYMVVSRLRKFATFVPIFRAKLLTISRFLVPISTKLRCVCESEIWLFVARIFATMVIKLVARYGKGSCEKNCKR